MYRTAMTIVVLVSAFAAFADEPDYPRDVTQWKEIAIPPVADSCEREVWYHAANDSNYEWRVFAQGDQVHAELTKRQDSTGKSRPKFIPNIPSFEARDAVAFTEVADGWLVGYNAGEWGGALYWFSNNGETNYKISDDQIIEFFMLSGEIHGLEGLDHDGFSDGSIIRITQPRSGAPWIATTLAELPYAPYAISIRKDNTMLITVTSALVAIGSDRKVRTLLHHAPWERLGIYSSALSHDENKLYWGLSQYVGEFDFKTKRLRFLVPSDQFLNKLPDEEADQIRKLWCR